MRFGSIVLLLFVFVLAQPVSGLRITCQQKNMLLNRRITRLYHRNRELLYTLKQKKPEACPRLSSPTYGDLSLDGLSVGDTATVTCDRGYELTGSSVRYCTSIGWNGTEADCVPVTCTPELSDPRDGSVSTPDGSEFEDEAVYSCNTGFELSESNGGSKRRSCLSSGSWSGAAPTCVRIECSPVLSNPVDGSVSAPDGIEFEDEAVYTCNTGFERLGSERRSCLSSGIWSGDAPICVRKKCTPELPNPGNGSVSTPDGTEFEDEAVYDCEPGFELRGCDRRICLGSGSWSGNAPMCDKIVECPSLMAPVGGSVDRDGPQEVGVTATYACDFGLVDGSVVRYCLADGTWSGTEPNCAAECMYGGNTYAHMDGFPSDGGCYHCTCNNGYVDCTTPRCQTEPVIVKASQSTEDNTLRPATNALDNDVKKTVSHTSDPIMEPADQNPWWMVEYVCPLTFRGVTVWNRIDCCPNRLDMFTVYIDDVECGKVTTDHPVSGGSKTIWCDPPLNGTKLRIQKDERDHLVLAEVVPIFNCH